MANFDREKILVLPPPPTKSKLKRVHTVSGGGGGGTGNNDNTNGNHDDMTKVLSANTTPNQSIPGVRTSGEMIFLDTENNEEDEGDDDDDEFSLEFWTITEEQRRYYLKQFASLDKHPHTGNVPGPVAKVFFEKSDLGVADLSRIWKLSDVDEDGQLSPAEFCIAMHMVVLRRNRVELPRQLPAPLLTWLATTSDNDGAGGKQDSLSAAHRPSQTRWTRFNDNEEENKIPSIRSAKPITGSPGEKLANFDYNPESLLATNPNIRHPVPIRMTPTTASPPGSAHFFQEDSTTKRISSSSISSSSPSSASSLIGGNINNSHHNNISNGIISGGVNVAGLTKKQIVDYLCNLEHRYGVGSTAATILASSPEISPPKSEDSHQTIRWLRDANQALVRRNQEMARDMGHLLRITRRLILDQLPPDS